MRFSCDECGRSYVAGDDVAGRAFRMRCRQCGNDIVVRPPGSSRPASPFSRGDASAASEEGTSATSGPPGPFSAPTSTDAASAPSSTSRAAAPPGADADAAAKGDAHDGEPAGREVPAAGAGRARRAGRSRPAFDPFDAVPEGELTVESDSHEIFERTPPARNLATPPPRGTGAAGTRPAIPAAPPAAARTTRTPAPPRGRAGRMLPAEDEAMLGPPGAEDRRAIPRWVIVLVVAAIAAAGGMVFLR